MGIGLQDYCIPICEAVDDPRFQRIAIKACHAVGKTFTLGAIVNAIMGRFSHTKLISTAPTFRQVHDLLWKEIHASYNKTWKVLQKGKLNEVSWWIDDDSFARGFSPQKKAAEESGQGTDSVFQGYHGKYLTVVIFDEATGVPPQIWNQAEGLLTSGQRVLFVAIANPTSRNCDFYDCFEKPTWKTISITCFDSPNLKAAGFKTVEDIEREASLVKRLQGESPELAMDRLNSYPCPIPYLINARWVVEMAIEWGVHDSRFKGKVLGEFPDSDSNSIIPLDLIQASQSREILEDIHEQEEAYVGLDVAREGEDDSVLTGLVGIYQDGLEVMSKNDTNEVSGRAINFIKNLKSKYSNIKRVRLAVDGGYGHGVIDTLRQLQKEMAAQLLDEKNRQRQYPETDDNREERREAIDSFSVLEGVEILEINFGASDWVIFHFGWIDEFSRKKKEQERKVQEDRQNYVNYKAKMFDLLRKSIRDEIVLEKRAVYIKQLPKIIKTQDSKGRLLIESKKDYKKRTGQSSPDEADSLALANFARFFAVQERNYVLEAFLND